MKPALLVIDVQKEFFKDDPETTLLLNSAVEYINEAVKLFREKKLPIVYVQHMDETDGLVPGTEGFDLPDAFDVQPGDIRVTKTYGNAFNKTGLYDKLKALGVETLIITGYCAEWCVLSTTRGAMDLDLNPIILLGSIASDSKENIHFVESINHSISLGALRAFMKD
jgi:nicotinamidase-related amidase